MTNRRAPVLDRLITYTAFDLNSAYCVAHPTTRYAKKVAGDNPTRWHAVRTHADDVPEWIDTPPDKDAGFFHSSITKGTLLAAPHDELAKVKANLEREFGGVAVAAAAFRIGKAVVTAEIPGYQGNQLTPPQDLPGHTAAILGIGDGVLHATIGAYHPDANEFMGSLHVTASDSQYLQQLAVAFPTTPRL